ncbi:MAG: tetratricopeptide repeat protein [Cytophagales bacterium]
MNFKLIVTSAILSGLSLSAQNAEEGLKFLDNEQYTKAKKLFSNLLSQKPNGDNYYYMGNYYNKIEEYDSAKVFFNKGIEVDSKNGLNYAGLGIVQWLKGDTNAAKTNFDQAIAIRKKDAEVYFEIAKTLTYNENKSLNKALSYIDLALTYAKSNKDNYLLTKGDIYLYKNNGTAAVENYNEALTINSKSVAAYIKKGKLYLRANNPDEALKLYKQGMDLDPNYAPAYRERSEVYFNTKKINEGLADYKKYLSITDDNFENNLRFAKFLYRNKEYAQVVEVCSKLESQDPKNVGVTRLKVYAQSELGKSSDVKAGFEKIKTLVSENNLIGYDYDVYGTALIASGDTMSGYDAKIKAAELDKRFNKNIPTIAKALYDKKQYEKAASLYDKAYQLKNIDFYGKLNWGKAYYLVSNYAKANETFTKLATDEPNIPNWFLWKVKSEVMLDQDYKTDNVMNAVNSFVASTEKLKDRTQYNKNLAEAYTYLGSYYCINKKSKLDAENSWKKALEFDPNYTAAKNALANVAGCK